MKILPLISILISALFYSVIWYLFGLTVMFTVFGLFVIANLITYFGTIWWLSRDINFWTKQDELNKSLTHGQ